MKYITVPLKKLPTGFYTVYSESYVSTSSVTAHYNFNALAQELGIDEWEGAFAFIPLDKRLPIRLLNIWQSQLLPNLYKEWLVQGFRQAN